MREHLAGVAVFGSERYAADAREQRAEFAHQREARGLFEVAPHPVGGAARQAGHVQGGPAVDRQHGVQPRGGHAEVEARQWRDRTYCVLEEKSVST